MIVETASTRKPKNITILGSTGSIGRNTLEVIARFPDRFRVQYLTGHRNIDVLMEQIRHFRPKGIVLQDECQASVLKKIGNGTTEILIGEEGLIDVATRPEVDLVVSALVGFAGVKPTLRAVEAGKDIALANKEALVVAGKLIMEAVRTHEVSLVPVDSEHSAILQCLRGESLDDVRRLILTASGGPFLDVGQDRFESLSVAEALEHPTWKMGRKISIDSATLMNKGLEVIEAYWLFGIHPEKIEVVIHPQSLIHSMVEFTDGSVKAQLGMPDMKLPIQYALLYPERPHAPHPRLDFGSLQQMTFFKPDMIKFRCLGLAFDALRRGGSVPAVLNAANEVAVQLFLEEKIPFSMIPLLIEEMLTSHTVEQNITLDSLIRIDKETRAALLQRVTA